MKSPDEELERLVLGVLQDERVSLQSMASEQE
jgi:hypothetical protein